MIECTVAPATSKSVVSVSVESIESSNHLQADRSRLSHMRTCRIGRVPNWMKLGVVIPVARRVTLGGVTPSALADRSEGSGQ